MNLMYFPLIISILLILLSAVIYYHHSYEIGDSSSLNKYKGSKENILIRLKFFKYNNNFNFILLIPYLIAWNLFFIVFILYIIYWCGIAKLEVFFASIWTNNLGIGLIIVYITYGAFIQRKIFYSNNLEKPDFLTDEEKNKKD